MKRKICLALGVSLLVGLAECSNAPNEPPRGSAALGSARPLATSEAEKSQRNAKEALTLEEASDIIDVGGKSFSASDLVTLYTLSGFSTSGQRKAKPQQRSQPKRSAADTRASSSDFSTLLK